ncbi:hypothetical protein G9A89_001026 [Geosiphon pyriformis]|nr:hypothetical protein G9A89_001026 [Geosiphon pyriformis]
MAEPQEIPPDNYLEDLTSNSPTAIYAALAREAQFRSLFATNPKHPSLKNPYVNLINVYENESLWKSDSERNSEGHETIIMALTDKTRLKAGEWAIEHGGNERFLRNWKLYTEGSLNGLDWNNVFAAGGAVLSCLLPIPKQYSSTRKTREYYHEKAYASSDIDLFIYGLNEEDAKQKMIEIYNVISDAVPWEVTCIRAKNCVTILSQYPYRHVQIILRLYQSPSEILTGFDLDCCCVGFDGQNVWALPRAHQAITKQCNVIDLTRRSPSYEMRLAKYAERGFEIKVPSLDRSRIDPTIYERSFEKLHGLARLLVLERLSSPDSRFKYIEEKRERTLRPKHPKAGTYASRSWSRSDNLRTNKFENNDYETVQLPYGPKYNAKRVIKLIYKKDLVMNSAWNQKTRKRKLHRHPCFFGTMEQVFRDCCGTCPQPTTPEEIELQEAEDKIFIRGEISFIKDDPGRQTVGSFNPLTDNDWAEEAFITPVREDLCTACAKGDLHGIKKLLHGVLDVNARDYFGRTPLQLAVMGGYTEAVQLLLNCDAKITARMADGRNVVHIAAALGFLDILILLLKKSDANKKAAKERDLKKEIAITGLKLEALSNPDQTEIHEDQESDGSLDIVDKMELDNNPPKDEDEPNILAIEEEEEEDDIIDLNLEAWDHQFTPLEYAILFGRFEVVKLLIENGANVRRPIKFKLSDSRLYYSSNYRKKKVYFPLGLSMITRTEKIGLKIATLLLENGAMASQLDYQYNTIFHLAVKFRKISFVQLFLDIDPKSRRVINALNLSKESPLAIAIMNGDRNMAELLLRNGAHVQVTLDDCKEFVARYNSSIICNAASMLAQVVQPITCALDNGLYKLLVEAGADVNTKYNQYETIRDRVQSNLEQSVSAFQEFNPKKVELLDILLVTKTFAPKIIDLDTVIDDERKKHSTNSYPGFILSNADGSDLNDYIVSNKIKVPANIELKYYTPPDTTVIAEPEEKKTQRRLEIEKRLNLQKECLMYLIGRGAKTLEELEPDESKKEAENATNEKVQQLQAIQQAQLLKLVEAVARAETEKEKQQLQEQALQLQQQILLRQSQLLQNALKQGDQSPEVQQKLSQLMEQMSGAPLNRVSVPSNIQKQPNFDIDVNKYIFQFTYFHHVEGQGYQVPEELVNDYVALYDAVFQNDIARFKKFSRRLVVAVKDRNTWTPLLLACYLGYEEMAVQILKAVEKQYTPLPKKKNSGNDDSEGEVTINNYDINVNDYTTDSSSDSDLYDYDEPTPLEDPEDPPEEPAAGVASRILNTKPTSHTTAYVFLQSVASGFLRAEYLPEKYWRKSDESKSKSNSLKFGAFTIATVKNQLKIVEAILKWAKEYECEDESFTIPEKEGGLVTQLIVSNHHPYMWHLSPIHWAIVLGHIDILDLFIEYGAAGNNFGLFDLEDSDKEEVIEFKKPKYYQGLDVDGSKKKSWIVRHNPAASQKPIAPSFLHLAAFYGNATSIKYFLSPQPIKALERFARKNRGHDIRANIINTVQDAAKIGRRLFTFEPYENQTPFHWAVEGNQPEAIKDLAKYYKPNLQKNDLELEEILDTRANNGWFTAFILAASTGKTECVEALLEVGADPGVVDESGWTGAHHATHAGHLKTLESLFLKLEENTAQRMLEQRSKKFNHSIIAIAILEARKETFKFLWNQIDTANIFSYDFQSDRYLHLATKQGLLGIAQTLLTVELENPLLSFNEDGKYGSLYHENAVGQTPVDMAIQLWCKKIKDNDQFTPPTVHETNSLEQEPADAESPDHTGLFDLFEPYLPRTPQNLHSRRVFISFHDVTRYTLEFTQQVTDGWEIGRLTKSYGGTKLYVQNFYLGVQLPSLF